MDAATPNRTLEHDPDTPIRGAESRSSPTPNRWVALLVLSLAQLMVILDSTIVNIALPTARRSLGFSNTDRQWVITGYALAFGSLLLLGGRLSDLLGRKRMFIVGVIRFAAASAVGGAAPSFDVLLIARVAQGAFAAVLAPAALSLVSVTFADNAKDRGRAFAIFGSVSGAGGALGLLLGGVLTQTASWRWCLLVNVVIAAVALVGALVWLRDTTPAARVRLDISGTLTVILGLVGIVYGLGNAASQGWSNPTTLGCVIAGLALVSVFVLIERRTPAPLLPLRVLLDRNRGAAYLAIGLSGIGSFTVFLFLTYYLAETLRLTPIQTGIAFLPMIAMVVVGALLVGSLFMPRYGPKILVPVGCLLAAIGLTFLTGIGTASTYAGGVLPGLLILGFGFGFIFGPTQNAATSGADTKDAGVASALVNTAQQIGGSIGTAVFSAVAATAVTNYVQDHAAATDPAATLAAATISAYHLVFWIGAGVFLASGALTALILRSGPLLVTSDAVHATAA